jgi:hypothetical protein
MSGTCQNDHGGLGSLTNVTLAKISPEIAGLVTASSETPRVGLPYSPTRSQPIAHRQIAQHVVTHLASSARLARSDQPLRVS